MGVVGGRALEVKLRSRFKGPSIKRGFDSLRTLSLLWRKLCLSCCRRGQGRGVPVIENKGECCWRVLAIYPVTLNLPAPITDKSELQKPYSILGPWG